MFGPSSCTSSAFDTIRFKIDSATTASCSDLYQSCGSNCARPSVTTPVLPIKQNETTSADVRPTQDGVGHLSIFIEVRWGHEKCISLECTHTLAGSTRIGTFDIAHLFSIQHTHWAVRHRCFITLIAATSGDSSHIPSDSWYFIKVSACPQVNGDWAERQFFQSRSFLYIWVTHLIATVKENQPDTSL